MANKNRSLSHDKQVELLKVLETRFEKNKHRHPNVQWNDVQEKLNLNTEKLWSLNEMEETEGEPDVVGVDPVTGEFIFMDCSAETPKGRRSICYDDEALQARKENKPVNSAVNMALEMGIDVLTEEQYRELQTNGVFDIKTSSWVKTPDNIRKLGGAVFCDRRYDTIFMYHNGADSYYSARAFRGILKV